MVLGVKSLMAKFVAVKIMQAGSVLWRPEDHIFLKTRDGEVCPFFYLQLHNITLVVLESDPNGWMNFVCGPGLGNQEAEEHVCDMGGW